MSADQPHVTDDADRQRYEIHVYEGRGLRSALMAAALADARERGDQVLPFCPFVKAYLGRHPEELGLKRDVDRRTFGLV